MDFDEMIFDDAEFFDEDFAEIDALIEQLETLQRPEASILNMQRVQQMRFSCAAIKRALRETNSDASIDCRQHEFESSLGVVDIESVDIMIRDTEWFARAAEFANNTEIYPLKENKVRLTFGFHGLTMPIG